MEIKIDKDELIGVLWGICLAENLGDVADEMYHLTRPLGIEDNEYYGLYDLLELMKSKDLIPEYQRD